MPSVTSWHIIFPKVWRDPLHLWRWSTVFEFKSPVILLSTTSSFCQGFSEHIYLQTLLNQLATGSEGSSGTFSAWFRSGLHSNTVSFWCLCELGLTESLSRKCVFTKPQKIHLSFGLLFGSRVSKDIYFSLFEGYLWFLQAVQFLRT